MKKLNLRILSIAFFTVAFLGFQSCSEDGMSSDGESLTQTELQTILTTDAIAGVADFTIAELYNNNTAKQASSAKDDCYTATYTETGFEATFNNCVLNGTDNVNGTVSVSYTEGEGNSTFVATFTDFYAGKAKLNGTRTYKISANSTEATGAFTVTSNISVEMEDGSTISETGTKTLSISYDGEAQNILFALSGNWSVETEGNTYAVETLDDLEGNSACEHITTGAMVVSKNGLAVTVDFGNGDCDAIATLIYPNGATEKITL
ncbi:hypothetical protein K1F50_01475 [Muricauda oceani]|uniref:Lipocalin-like domain-containing protein n=1 Tax=Flagellimonas oceani TaxID=2698672 RepID=A0A6G7J116_9FLAO|nr:hypothetical protein [Allomuricauda oceani]MBW8241451.1 hypothetical protein [Allomuricauda oceani]QII44553.1 hypothetical protein GVT53_07635 [Allomuricauda oceani]